MQTPYSEFTRFIFELFQNLTDIFQPLGIPFGPIAWFYIITVAPLFVIILVLVVRKRGAAKDDVTQGIQRIIASTGDVSSGISGTKKLGFITSPSDALVFLKIEENAIKQALSAAEYYSNQGDLDSEIADKIATVYNNRLAAVQTAIAKDQDLKDIVDADTAIDKARSDYLQKLAAMSGTAVESDTEEAGPPSVGPPTSAAEPTSPVEPAEAGPPSGGPPGGAAPSAGPPGGAPSGGPPSGGPPSGGPPTGGPPTGSAPSSGVPPGGDTPSAEPPSGAAPSAGPPGGVPSSAPPTAEAAPAEMAAAPDTVAKPSTSGSKSSLQSEMLAEMERLKALMSGD
ncbi:hypothetical protein EU537_01400 [Candidatus Thorarchaeota archaeon]|nr:MAG: hypothetical protein EU537_01400 [Candidatus Thorarchaeota archaeon]